MDEFWVTVYVGEERCPWEAELESHGSAGESHAAKQMILPAVSSTKLQWHSPLEPWPRVS